MELNHLPDIQFVETNLDVILQETIAGYEKAYLEQYGQEKKLFPGDPIRIYLYSQALREFQLRKLIDYSAKQNLLKYAKGDYLRHIGATKGVDQLGEQKATVLVRFNLSTALTSVYTIPAGLRVGPGNNLYFETTSPIEIPAGMQEVIGLVTCTVPGTIGNGFAPGQINIISDPQPYLISVVNIETSKGGSDVEDEESYRERIHLAPEGFSVAGPEGAYIYFAKSFSPLVLDVKAHSPSDGVVDLRLLLQDGELPSECFLQEAFEYLNAKDRRPLTDKLQVNAPDTVDYDIDLDYYILDKEAAAVASIQENVEKAIADYQLWQKAKIGRDINPSELISRVIRAGAKRVDVRSPVFTDITDQQVAISSAVQVQYGGIESD
ncbi:baseplate assembly protein [Bacillus infantis]|uniref:baseplate assembly protein n=1 Tax=Bacillus infantis TaxID=324767 RepID=UPI001653DDA5|nr:baseplate J/gp47 family protein [Bacillus infantis]